MPSGFSAQHFAKGAAVNDSSVSNSTTYSSSKIEQRLAAVSAGGGGGGGTFVGLSDTPASLTAGQSLRANASGTALEFYTPASGIAINDASVSSSSVYSSQKIDSTYLQQSKVKNATSTTAGDVYDATYLNTQLANKANASHTHVINDVTNLQTSLDAKLETSKVKNATSTTAGDVYDVRHVNTELAGKANASHTHVINDVTNLQTSLDAKIDKTSIQTTAEGESTSETDVYSCNAVYSKNQINTSVTSQTITVNHPTTTGTLNFGSNLTSGLYGSIQSYANSTRYSGMHHYATSGNCNLDWYFMKNNSETRMITVRPNDSEKVFEVLNGGIKAPIFQQRDSTTIIKIGRMDSASYGIPGMAIIPLLNTVNSEIQMRGLRNTGILGDSYVYHQNGSTLTIQSRFATNRHSATHSNIEVSTYQNGAETKVLEIGASSGTAKTVTVTGTLHATGHVTTDQNNFTANDQLVTKAFVDTSIANLVDSAPSTLDTLNELAAALGNDPNFATTVTNNIATKLPIANVQTATSTTSGHVYDVTYLNTQLAGKANTSHTHAISEITNLQTTLDSKLNLTGGSLSGHVTTNQVSFTSSNQLVSKNYVDTRLPTDVDTPVSYTIQNAVTDQNYLFGVNGAANEMALVEIPKVYTGVPASSRSVRVGFNGGDYGSGMVSLGYEALADGSGSAGQTNAVRSVAVGYQAGFQSQAANHGIYIGPYQGYQLSTSNQLRIGNSGVSPTTAGYDKAIIEGTMATTDAGQTLRLNADTIYLGSSLPTSQPADNRLWLSNGNLSIGAVSGGVSTFLSLTDTPASYTNGKLLYSTASGIAYTTDQIVIDGGNIEVSQLNARQNGVTNIGDNSHKFNNVFCNAIHQGDVRLILPTVRGSVNQILKVQSVNSEVHTLIFADDNASSGGGGTTIPNSKKIDQLKLSGNTLTAEDGTTTYDAYGILWGDRYMTYVVENQLIRKRDGHHPKIHNLFNGYRAPGFSPFDDAPYIVIPGGHIIWQHIDGLYLKLNALHFHWWGSVTPNISFAFYGSNDKVTWTKLKEWNHSDTTAYSNGYATTSYTINGASVSIPARGPSNLTKTVYNGSTALSNTSNSNGCRRYVFDNTNFYMFYMLKNTAIDQHPNINDGHNVNIDNQLEWEF